uniref:protein BTG3-like isoform X2 n=1 Tax=Doryrhamphus excisus TaxID=161450 RepID=UPI0025ADB049|nr:protein BTG3-like isoform X2 [Doryrhamphus excisus]
MERELSAVVYLMKMLVTKRKVSEIELFTEKLANALKEKFQGHWYPDNPSKGQAYRCIRVNMWSSSDPEIMRACHESGVNFCDLGLPPILTLWVDPGEVSCRIGENSPSFLVAKFSQTDDKEKDTRSAKKKSRAVRNNSSFICSGVPSTSA